MKHKFSITNILLLGAVILFTAPAVYCAPVSIKQTAGKFLLAMSGVALSAFIIFAGLTIYNKFFVRATYGSGEKDKSLTTPDNIDDAVTFFIKKNKLR